MGLAKDQKAKKMTAQMKEGMATFPEYWRFDSRKALENRGKRKIIAVEKRRGQSDIDEKSVRV